MCDNLVNFVKFMLQVVQVSELLHVNLIVALELLFKLFVLVHKSRPKT